MADPVTDQIIIAVVLFAVAMGILAFFEIRFLRKRMKGRRKRLGKRDDELADQAHNAVTTTKAILSAMDRQGVRSGDASSMLREADMALARHNYRVVIDLTSKTRDRLMSAKAAQATRGDLAKLEQVATVGGSTDVTTKERIQKEFPPNLLQSKFSIELAGTAIETARTAGRGTDVATQLLDSAKARFDSQDYDGALRFARQSKRSADGEAIELPPAVAPAAPSMPAGDQSCPSCGASIRPDDAFCRKCGTRLGPGVCASCGAELLADDGFCRKCGTPFSR
ncbi:MAG TPA: zinc ribbon domain-containing protein [Thermoplasmata archaeon]|nr:zinc ribbon domain-containing protein [Thermoplasmata archaeon]